MHTETIAVAIAEKDGEVCSVGNIANRPESVKRLVSKLGAGRAWAACYEAGPTGYALYWQLSKPGKVCEVIAPTLVPTKAGDRVKTDRRDAERLARCYSAGELTAVWVPDAAHEALRDLVRVREAAKQDQLRARQRLGKFLLRHGKSPPQEMRAWTQWYLDWIKREVKFDQTAQQATLEDWNEVEHCGLRIVRLEKAIDEAVQQAPENMREVIEALQALRGGGQRILQRPEDPTGRNYQDRQRPSVAGHRRGGVVAASQTTCELDSAGAPKGFECGSAGDRNEGTSSSSYCQSKR